MNRTLVAGHIHTPFREEPYPGRLWRAAMPTTRQLFRATRHLPEAPGQSPEVGRQRLAAATMIRIRGTAPIRESTAAVAGVPPQWPARSARTATQATRSISGKTTSAALRALGPRRAARAIRAPERPTICPTSATARIPIPPKEQLEP
jgi:hypothetical protein